MSRISESIRPWKLEKEKGTITAAKTLKNPAHDRQTFGVKVTEQLMSWSIGYQNLAGL
jgi:hypothetical protein